MSPGVAVVKVDVLWQPKEIPAWCKCPFPRGEHWGWEQKTKGAAGCVLSCQTPTLSLSPDSCHGCLAEPVPHLQGLGKEPVWDLDPAGSTGLCFSRKYWHGTPKITTFWSLWSYWNRGDKEQLGKEQGLWLIRKITTRCGGWLREEWNVIHYKYLKNKIQDRRGVKLERYEINAKGRQLSDSEMFQAG